MTAQALPDKEPTHSSSRPPDRRPAEKYKGEMSTSVTYLHLKMLLRRFKSQIEKKGFFLIPAVPSILWTPVSVI